MVAGSPNEILASSNFNNEGVDSKTSMVFKYDNGVVANLSCSMYDSQPNRAIISGSDGYIEIDHTFYAPTTIKLCRSPLTASPRGVLFHPPAFTTSGT